MFFPCIQKRAGGKNQSLGDSDFSCIVLDLFYEIIRAVGNLLLGCKIEKIEHSFVQDGIRTSALGKGLDHKTSKIPSSTMILFYSYSSHDILTDFLLFGSSASSPQAETRILNSNIGCAIIMP